MLSSCRNDTEAISAVNKTDNIITNEDQVNHGRLDWQKPEWLLNTLGDISNKTIADIGAGSGYFTFRLVQRKAKVIAIDVDPQMISILNLFRSNLDSVSQSMLEIRQVPVSDPQLSHEEVDIVMLVNTIGYIDNLSDYLDKIRYGLKKDGLLVIVDFKSNIDVPISITGESEFIIDNELLKTILAKNGFRFIEVDDMTLPYQFVMWLVP